MTRSPGFYFLFFIFQIHSKWEWETASTCFVGFCTCVCIYLSKERKRNGRRGWVSDLFFAPTNWKSIYHPIPQLPVFEVLAGILLRESLSWHAYAKRLWTIVPCAWSALMFSSLRWMNLFFDTRFQKNLESWARTGKIPKVPQVLLGFQRFW